MARTRHSLTRALLTTAACVGAPDDPVAQTSRAITWNGRVTWIALGAPRDTRVPNDGYDVVATPSGYTVRWTSALFQDETWLNHAYPFVARYGVNGESTGGGVLGAPVALNLETALVGLPLMGCGPAHCVLQTREGFTILDASGARVATVTVADRPQRIAVTDRHVVSLVPSVVPDTGALDVAIVRYGFDGTRVDATPVRFSTIGGGRRPRFVVSNGAAVLAGFEVYVGSGRYTPGYYVQRVETTGTVRAVAGGQVTASPEISYLTVAADGTPNEAMRRSFSVLEAGVIPIAVGTLTSRAIGTDGTVAAFAYTNASGLLSVVRLNALGDVLDVDPWRIPGDTANAFRPTSITGGGGRWTVAASNAVAQFDASGTFLRRVALPGEAGKTRVVWNGREFVLLAARATPTPTATARRTLSAYHRRARGPATAVVGPRRLRGATARTFPARRARPRAGRVRARPAATSALSLGGLDATATRAQRGRERRHAAVRRDRPVERRALERGSARRPGAPPRDPARCAARPSGISPPPMGAAPSCPAAWERRPCGPSVCPGVLFEAWSVC